jgi:hypothetical protein
MKMCKVPARFELDLGYRKLWIEAGERAYPDEVADNPRMTQYVISEEKDEAKPAEKDEPAKAKRS